MHIVKTCLRTLLLAICCAALLNAQTGGTGSIYGTVQDPSEASIPNTDVMARNQDTGTERKTVTTATGDYVFANLPVGTYVVRVSKQGFKTFSQEGISLQVDRRARVDVVLQVGTVSEQVVVKGEAPLIEASKGTLSTVVDEKRMAELPLNGRNPLELTLLVGGVQPTSGAFINQAFTNPNQQFVSSSGGRGNTIVYNLDGADNSDSYTNVANVYPNPDALREFSFVTNAFSAEFGRRSGGVVNAITRSGTNQFHGSVFEFFRNYNLNATNFFTAGRPDGLKRNQYGASVGGPIRKDKTFFFAAWQGTKIRQLPATSTTVVPTQAMRNGDFSGLRASNGAPVIVKDPDTGVPFSNNQIPVGRFDPIAVKLLNNIPVPSDPTGLLRYAILNTSDDDQVTARVDHMISASNQLTGRILYDTLHRGNSILPGTLLGASYTPNFRSYNLTLSDTQTFSPSLLGTFSFTFNRLWSGYNNGYPTTLAQLGAKIFDLSPNPSISLGVGGFFGIGDVGAAILVRNNFQYQSGMTYVFGRHELKFGADILRQQFNIPVAAYLCDGSFSFSNQFSGSNMTDFFLGRPSSFTQITPWAEALRGLGPGFYVQDNFKVTRRLTLNLGLRWEPLIPWVDIRNYETGVWRPGAQSTRAPNLPPNLLVAKDPGVPTAGYDGSMRKFDPRLGLAYLLPDGKTSIRLGYGVFHEFPNSKVNNVSATTAPFAVRVDIQNPPSIGNPFTAAIPNPFPTTLPPPSSFPFPRPIQAVTYGDNFTNPYAQQWNVTVERQFATTWVARISYEGSEGTKLLSQRELNPALVTSGATLANTDQRRIYAPNWTNVQALESAGTSSYNGVSLTVEKRLASGFSILAHYTFSKSLDEESNITGTGQASFANPYNREYDRGLSDYDHTHRFVASYLWALPSPNAPNTFVRHILGGWQTNGIITLQSGTPFSVLDGTNRSLDGVGSDRADLVGSTDLYTSDSRGRRIAQYFNTSDFAINAFGTYGTSGRNILRGPGLATVNFSVFKNVRIREKIQLQYRTEFFNLFNRVNLNNPTSTANSPIYGRITSANDPRILQLALRLEF